MQSFQRTVIESYDLRLIFLLKACFDVREASVFWNKLAFLEEVDYLGTQLELLSTHPSHQKRSTAIDELIPGALKFRELCKVDTYY